MGKIKLDSNLLARAKDAAVAAGYSSVEEFVSHVLEQEIVKHEGAGSDDEKVADQLRGLGYIE
jgi:hypothetical protein